MSGDSARDGKSISSSSSITPGLKKSFWGRGVAGRDGDSQLSWGLPPSPNCRCRILAKKPPLGFFVFVRGGGSMPVTAEYVRSLSVVIVFILLFFLYWVVFMASPRMWNIIQNQKWSKWSLSSFKLAKIAEISEV